LPIDNEIPFLAAPGALL